MIQSAEDRQLDDLVCKLARTEETSTPELTAALDEMGQSITSGGLDSTKRSHRRRYAAVAGAAVLSLSIAVPAAANWFGAHTQLFGQAGQTENDTREWLRLGSPELDGIVDQLGAKYPLPAGGDWSETKRSLRGGGGREEGLMQESGVELTVASNAQCQWQRSWLDANANEDNVTQDAATAMLRAIPNWQILKDHDGGGTIEFHSRVAEAAAQNDRAVVRNAYSANCASVYGSIER